MERISPLYTNVKNQKNVIILTLLVFLFLNIVNSEFSDCCNKPLLLPTLEDDVEEAEDDDVDDCDESILCCSSTVDDRIDFFINFWRLYFKLFLRNVDIQMNVTPIKIILSTIITIIIMNLFEPITAPGDDDNGIK